MSEDRERAEPNKSEIRRAVETLDEIPVQYADTNEPPKTKSENFVAARDGLARAYAGYRRELLPAGANGEDVAEGVVVRIVKAVELSLNDRKGLHLDDLGAEIRRDIRAEWYRLLNPIVNGALAAVRNATPVPSASDREAAAKLKRKLDGLYEEIRKRDTTELHIIVEETIQAALATTRRDAEQRVKMLEDALERTEAVLVFYPGRRKGVEPPDEPDIEAAEKALLYSLAARMAEHPHYGPMYARMVKEAEEVTG